MGKSRKGKLSERQLRMIELRAAGETYVDIGNLFNISGSGARDNIRVAARLLSQHGLDALPDGCSTKFSVEELISSVPKFAWPPVPKIESLLDSSRKESVQDSVSVVTPFGEIFVSVKQDPNYPGVYIDLKGPDVNETFQVGAQGLAMVEFDPEKKKIQTVVYGNGVSEEPTHVIEHENVLKREVSKPSLTDQIRSAQQRTAGTDNSGFVKEAPER